MSVPTSSSALSAILSGAGFLAADEEAGELLARAAGDGALLESLLVRRLTGEPLAWITGQIEFCGTEIQVDPGVYVPRWHTEAIARRAIAWLPVEGAAIDLCTGSGAIARVLSSADPGARVVASELEQRAVVCAQANGVEAYQGDLFDPLPRDLLGSVDVVVGVLPYVPTSELGLLQRDTFSFEDPRLYDGGGDGADLLRRAIAQSPAWLRPGGALLLELGGEQAPSLAGELARAGFVDATVIVDDDDDVRAIEATLGEAALDGS